jgi:Ca2+-binding EF-hand superfamily protein
MKTLILSAVLGTTLLAGPALAQTPPADTNRDRVVTRAEAAAQADRRFAEMDANRDGKITAEERRAHRAAHRPNRPGPDANRDGTLTRDEAIAAAARRFDRADANHDGKLTADERPARHGRHRGMRGPREGGDREVTQAQHRERALARFDRVDANHDGRIDANEREAAKLVMRARMAGGER